MPLVDFLKAQVTPDVAAAAAESWKRERTEAALAAARYEHRSGQLHQVPVSRVVMVPGAHLRVVWGGLFCPCASTEVALCASRPSWPKFRDSCAAERKHTQS